MGWTEAGLWLAVIASGAYHGLNPSMGWPLAVSAGLMDRSTPALLSAIGYLSAGHLLAMLAAMLPFAMLAALIAWQQEVQIGASVLLIGFGAYLLVWPRHPRVLARIHPAKLGLWSFAIAMAHGAGFMLVPVYLGLCRGGGSPAGQLAASSLMGASLGMALLVAIVHTAIAMASGGALAWLVYRYLGLAFLSRSWFNLDTVWAVSLMLVGVLSLTNAIR